MDTNTSSSITKELYNKNVELVNANKTLELLQKLYEFMIDSSSVEVVSQRFIDTIATTMGFPDGLVVIKDNEKHALKIVGLTQTEINKTILDFSGLSVTQVRFPLNFERNIFTEVIRMGESRSIGNIVELWTPLIGHDDVQQLSQIVQNQTGFVFPILFGDQIYGAFAVTHAKNSQNLTDFEQKALSRLSTVFGIAIDRVTTARELRTAQQSELDKARELVKLKDEFVFIATHDLRTPVTAIDGFLNIIKVSEDKLSEDMQDNLKNIEHASRRLTQLVNDLLEVARGEAGTIKITPQPLSITKIVEQTVNEVTPVAEENGVKIITNFDSSHTKVMGDEEKLNEILENLLSNAIKFSKEGGSVYVNTKPLSGNYLQIEVADTGHGIPEKEQEKIFQKFVKVRTDATTGIPGTGLGLFVVRMLVEKLGGKITFKSIEGRGTSFAFTLPLAS